MRGSPEADPASMRRRESANIRGLLTRTSERRTAETGQIRKIRIKVKMAPSWRSIRIVSRRIWRAFIGGICDRDPEIPGTDCPGSSSSCFFGLLISKPGIFTWKLVRGEDWIYLCPVEREIRCFMVGVLLFAGGADV